MKKKLYSKKFLATLVILSYLVGSAPIYAATVINPDFLSYLELYFDNKAPGLSNQIDIETSKLLEIKKAEIAGYIDSYTDQAMDNMDEYILQEVDRIDNELNTYLDTLFSELPIVVESEEARLKDTMSSYTNSVINTSKEELYYQLSIELQNHMMEEIENESN